MKIKRILLIVLCVLLFFASAAGGAFVAKINQRGTTTIIPGGDVIDQDLGRVNVLLLGKDKVGGLTDTIIVVSADTKTGSVDTLTVPRDTRVNINGRMRKINEAYSVGVTMYKNGKAKSEEEVVVKTVKELTHIPIHHYMLVDTSGFDKIIDILGGVEVDVPMRMYYNDPEQDLHIDLQPGLQVLNGEDAEGFVRFRSGYPDADIGRGHTQQYFLKCLLEQKLKPQYITKANDIINELLKYVKTSLDFVDIVKYVPFATKVSMDKVTMHDLPATPQTISGISYVVMSESQKQEMATMAVEYFGGSSSPQ